MHSWLNSSGDYRQRQLVTLTDVSEQSDVVGYDDGFQYCLGQWKPAHHAVFHVAHSLLIVSFLTPNTHRTVVFVHLALVAGYAVLSAWSWRLACLPDSLSWNVSFVVINSVQFLVIVSRLRPICLSTHLQQLYSDVFRPLRMSRQTFKKLVSANICCVQSLAPGTLYAEQDVTKTNRLAFLISGLVQVSRDGVVLHVIQPGQFLDSSQYEAAPQLDNTFKVSMTSLTHSCCVVWNRQLLDCLLSKEPLINAIMSHLIGRDVTNKAYQSQKRGGQFAGFVDVRLGPLSPTHNNTTTRARHVVNVFRRSDSFHHNGGWDGERVIVTNGIGVAAF